MSAAQAKTRTPQARVPLLNATEAKGPLPPSQLMAALLKVQAQAPKLAPNADGQIGPRAYRYVTLDAVVDAVLPLLVEHELAWATFPTSDESGAPALRYKITHVPSGEAEEDVMPLVLAKADPQGVGSALTYMRRYALVAVLNLTTGDDDDGQAASAEAEAAHAELDARSGPQPTAAPPKPSERRVTANQREKLLKPRAQKAGLSDGEFANVILIAGGAPPRQWRSEEHATQTLDRLLDQLPARLKDAVLDGIAKAAEAKP